MARDAASESRSVTPDRKHVSAWICCGLAVVTFLSFLPVFQNDFVNYDDPDYVTANSHVVSGLTMHNVAWAFTATFASNWHPLTWISHMLDCSLFGLQPAAHHAVSLGLHIVNTMLLYLVLVSLTGAVWPSAVVAAAFGLHPCHVESVVWASERKDVLSALFGLLTIWSYGAYARKRMPNAQNPKRYRLYYGLSLLLFALGLMSKPMLVTWPFVLLLLDYWPLGRIDPPRSGWKPAGRLLLEKTPFFLLSLGSCVITFFAQRKGGAVSTSIEFPARIENAVVAYMRYIVDLLWPHDLAVLYPHPGTWPRTEVILSAGFLIVLTALVCLPLFLKRNRSQPIQRSPSPLQSFKALTLQRFRYLPAAWFWYLGTLVPVIGLIQVGVQSMADRYTYLPYIGLFIMIAWLLNDLAARFSKASAESSPGLTPPFAAVTGIVSVALLAAAVATNNQVRLWRNSETLFRHAAHVTKDNYLAYNNLGFYLSNRGQTEEAIENYRMALRIKPNYDDAWNNLGYALAAQKKYSDAIQCYDRAIELRPNHIEAHNNRGNAYSDIGRIEDAIRDYQFVLKNKPDHADAHNNYGVVLAMRGQFDEAIEHFHAALRYKPGYASAHSNLGNTYAVQHKLSEAIAEYETALKLSPTDAQTHNNLGNVYSEQGRIEDAIKEYEQALKLKSDNPEAHFNLGVVLLRRNQRDPAANHFREALRLKPDYAEARTQLEKLTNSTAP